MTSGSFQNLSIDEVNLDTSNPRICRFFGIYDQTEIGDHHIGLTLNVPSYDVPTELADTTTP